MFSSKIGWYPNDSLVITIVRKKPATTLNLIEKLVKCRRRNLWLWQWLKLIYSVWQDNQERVADIYLYACKFYTRKYKTTLTNDFVCVSTTRLFSVCMTKIETFVVSIPSHNTDFVQWYRSIFMGIISCKFLIYFISMFGCEWHHHQIDIIWGAC